MPFQKGPLLITITFTWLEPPRNVSLPKCINSCWRLCRSIPKHDHQRSQEMCHHNCQVPFAKEIGILQTSTYWCENITCITWFDISIRAGSFSFIWSDDLFSYWPHVSAVHFCHCGSMCVECAEGEFCNMDPDRTFLENLSSVMVQTVSIKNTRGT